MTDHFKREGPPASRCALVSFVCRRPHAATPSKGRLTRCTVLGSTPKRLAIPRTPSPVHLRSFRAARTMASSGLFVETLPFAEPSPPAPCGPTTDTIMSRLTRTPTWTAQLYPGIVSFVPQPPPAPACNRSEKIVTVPSEGGGTRQIKIIRCP